MITKVYSERKVIGFYDHEANTMDTSHPLLESIPASGVLALSGGVEGGRHFTHELTVKPGDPEFFFAFVDSVERMGFDVDKNTEREYVRRRRAQGRARAS